MCDDHADHAVEAVHRAKKRYTCTVCRRPIRVGERYSRSALWYEGECIVWKMHVRCRDLSVAIDEHGCLSLDSWEQCCRSGRAIWRRSIRSDAQTKEVLGALEDYL